MFRSRKIAGYADGYVTPLPVFEAKLPLKMKAFAGANSIYWFDYKDNQVIFAINESYEKNVLKRDSVYVPAAEDLEYIAQRHYNYRYRGWLVKTRAERIVDKLASGHFLNPRRKNVVVVKDGIEVVFFNIKPKNFDEYYDLVVNSLTIIEREKPYYENTNMSGTEFFPQRFHNVKLGYNETEMNECSPGYPEELFSTNKILINIPEKIVLRLDKDNELHPVIPVCASYIVSLRRIYKYNDLSIKILYIKNIETEEVFSGEIVQHLEYGTPLPPPNYEEQQQRKRQLVAEAQSYDDDDLGDGLAGANYLNINLIDYVDIPFLPGKYEVWLSFSGLESNHCFVEIITGNSPKP